ncbi:MAG: ATP-binding protein [Chloroflexi bacterium]|nr:ATP-binding protein [Chloroflexota bacterium]
MMRPHQIENWVLSVIDRLEAGHPIEDSRVELKSKWTPPEKAARQIAGHANAVRGELILWIIGIDEDKGLVGAQFEELSEWIAQVNAQFDQLHPPMMSYNVPVKDKTVVALVFETDRAPFVVKNPAHGKPEGGPVELEVPWREGTAVRSARREELLRILSPLQSLPKLEVLGATLMAWRAIPPITSSPFEFTWALDLDLYIEGTKNDVIIPFHRCKASFEVPGSIGVTESGRVSLDSRSPVTIETTYHEALISGPGMLVLRAAGPRSDLATTYDHEAQVRAHLLPVDAERSVEIQATLPYEGPGDRPGWWAHKWELRRVY